MIVGTVKELKTEEYRVGLTPEGVRDLARLGHGTLVETGAGAGSGYADEAYAAAGATIVASAGDVNGDGYSDVIVGSPALNSGPGTVSVYQGSAAGLPASASWTSSRSSPS